MKGILKLAYKLLVGDTAKFTALLIGITFAVFLIIQMTAIFAGVLHRASGTVFNINSTIWVMEPSVDTVANTIGMPDFVLDAASLPPLRQSLTQSENLLAQLSGKLPASGIPAFIALPGIRLPADLPVTLPSGLVRQRPDIVASEAQLHSASASIGYATAALFPSISLSGTYGVSNTGSNKLFTSASPFWSLGPQLTVPVFSGGTLWFEGKAAIDNYQVAEANYRQTVLSAFTQVANTLRALEHDAEALDAESQALATA